MEKYSERKGKRDKSIKASDACTSIIYSYAHTFYLEDIVTSYYISLFAFLLDRAHIDNSL